MKAYFYMALAVAFIVIFQQNPLFGTILIGIMGGGYLYFKSRKKSGRTGIFRGGRSQSSQESSQALLAYLILQQFSNHDSLHEWLHDNPVRDKDVMNENDKAREEMLKLLE